MMDYAEPARTMFWLAFGTLFFLGSAANVTWGWKVARSSVERESCYRYALVWFTIATLSVVQAFW